MKSKVFAALLACLISAPTLAEGKDDTPALRELVTCSPSKNITKLIAKVQGMDAEKRDVVDSIFEAKFTVHDGGSLPKRIFLRDYGVEEAFTLNPDGTIVDFQKIGSASETAEMCTEDPTRIGTPRGGDGLKFSLNSDVVFLENPGYHDLTSLNEGLTDGKSHYKKMVPAPMRMIVPKMTYVMIDYDNDDTDIQFAAMSGQTPMPGLSHELFCDNAMIKIEDIEEMGGDGLKIMGGAYNLMPVPKPKTLAKFAQCADDEEDENKEE